MEIHPPATYRERRARLSSPASVWTRTIVAGDDTPVLPDGCMDLLWVAGRLVVAGPDTRGYQAAGSAGAQVAGIRFFPGVAPAVLGVPAHQLLDRRTDLADLRPAAQVRGLTALVAAAPNPMAGLERAACRLAADAEPADPVLCSLVRRLAGGAPVSQAADELGVGARRLHRMSLSAFGYGPKMLSQVLRMQRALALARGRRPFADVAAEAGYADQAHLAREVRRFAGRPLGQLIPAHSRQTSRTTHELRPTHVTGRSGGQVNGE